MFEAISKLNRRLPIKKDFVSDKLRDVFLASYPRSGNTWLRAIIYALETRVPPNNLYVLDYVVPDEHYTVKINISEKSKRHIVKTHNLRQEYYPNFLYIMRNPISATESYHRYIEMQTGKKIAIDKFALDAALGRIWPGSWSEHVNSWIAGNSSCYVRFEDLISLEPSALQIFATRLSYNDTEVVRYWIKYFDMKLMKKLELTKNRESEEKKGNDWFIGGKSSLENKLVIRETFAKYRPEIIELAMKSGYDLANLT